MFRLRHVSLFPFLATCAVALTLAISAPVQAASSYFMVQGPLAPGGVYETYKFRVEYTGVLQISGFDSGEQNSGYALLAAIFGNGAVSDPTNYSNDVGGVNINSWGLVEGFRIEGGNMVFPGSWPDGEQWNYFTAGGSYVNSFVDPVEIGDYPDGEWTWSKTGISSRYLEDGSFDAWSYAVMEDSGEEDEWGPILIPPLPAGVEPTLADFIGPLYEETKVSADGLPFTVYRITSVPEPGRLLLVLAGIGVVLMRRSRGACV